MKKITEQEAVKLLGDLDLLYHFESVYKLRYTYSNNVATINARFDYDDQMEQSENLYTLMEGADVEVYINEEQLKAFK